MSHTGTANPRTLSLRPRCALSLAQQVRARDMRRGNPALAVETIAARLGVDAEQVTLALATLRTKLDRPRHIVNCSAQAYDRVRREAQPGEPAWRTLDRLLGVGGEG